MNERFKEPVLYIGDIGDDINLSGLPTTGEEYIKRVMFEARQCDDVVYAPIDEKRLKKPTLNVKPLPECEKAPEYASPTQEWQSNQIADFSTVRLYIAQIRDEILSNKRKVNHIDINLPHTSHKSKWIDVCTKDSLYIEPTLTVILSMNQPLIEQVLEYLTEYLDGEKSIPPLLGQWLYALLVALELPLNPDMCSCLRSLARTCSTMRSQLDQSSASDAVSLNLFICIVARYFRQLDLADP